MSGHKRTVFHPFDRDAEIEFRSRHLPHWFQAGVATFVTFRTIDSMPRNVVRQWHDEILQWLGKNGFCPDGPPDRLPEIESLPGELQAEYRRVRNRGWQDHLDHCHGACVLRRPELARLVTESLLHFNAERYNLDCFVIMPNHVHLIVQFREGFTLRQQTDSWLRYSARQINLRLQRKGAFWQAEPFDHLIRSEMQFEYLRDYIRDNPQRAGLQTGKFVYWKS